MVVIIVIAGCFLFTDSFIFDGINFTLRKDIDARDNAKFSVVNPKANLIYTKYNINLNNWNFKDFPYLQLNDKILPSYYEKYKSVVSSRYAELQWGIIGVWSLWKS